MEYNISNYAKVKLISKDIADVDGDIILGTGTLILKYFLPDSMQILEVGGVKFNRLVVEDESSIVLNEEGLIQQVSFGTYISKEKFEKFKIYINELGSKW